jgi:hypothetical protein
MELALLATLLASLYHRVRSQEGKFASCQQFPVVLWCSFDRLDAPPPQVEVRRYRQRRY